MPHRVCQRVGDRRQEQPDPRQSIRVRTKVLDNLINTTGELITNKHRLLNVSKAIGSTQLGTALEELSRLLRELHNEVLNVRMMPFASISDRFPRIIRDLAQKSGKEVAFDIDGKEIELDRGILEQLSDPLVHILRNAVDHGLETGADRQASGKNEQGRIRLSVSREKDLVVVTIEDDGRGFWPGAPATVQDGNNARPVGTGLANMRRRVESLGGNFELTSHPGQGTRITIQIPLPSGP